MSNLQRFKAGGTFSFGCVVTLPAGVWTARAELRQPSGNRLLSALQTTLTPVTGQAGQYTLLLVASATTTSAWPAGLANGDVVFADATGVVLPSSTFTLEIVPKVTV